MDDLWVRRRAQEATQSGQHRLSLLSEMQDRLLTAAWGERRLNLQVSPISIPFFLVPESWPYLPFSVNADPMGWYANTRPSLVRVSVMVHTLTNSLIKSHNISVSFIFPSVVINAYLVLFNMISSRLLKISWFSRLLCIMSSLLSAHFGCRSRRRRFWRFNNRDVFCLFFDSLLRGR